MLHLYIIIYECSNNQGVILSTIQKCPKCGYAHKEYSKNADGGVLICLRCNYSWKSKQTQDSNLLGNYKYTKKIDTQALFNVKKGAVNKVPSNMLIARLKEKKFDNNERIINIKEDNFKISENIKQHTKNVVVDKDKPKFKNIFFPNSQNKVETQAINPDREKLQISKEKQKLEFNQEKAEYLKNKQPDKITQTNNFTRQINEVKTPTSKPLQELSAKINMKDTPSYDHSYIANHNNISNKPDLDQENINRDYNLKKDLDINYSTKRVDNKKVVVPNHNKTQNINSHLKVNHDLRDHDNKNVTNVETYLSESHSNPSTKNQEIIQKPSYQNKNSDISTKIDLSKGYDKSQFVNKQNLVNELINKALDNKQILSNINKPKDKQNSQNDIEKLSNISKLNVQKTFTNEKIENISDITKERKTNSNNQSSVANIYVKSKYPNINKQNYSELIESVKNDSKTQVFSKEELENKKKNLKPFEITSASKIDDLKRKFSTAVSEQETFVSHLKNFENNTSKITKNSESIQRLYLKNIDKKEHTSKYTKAYKVNEDINNLHHKLRNIEETNNNVNHQKIANATSYYEDDHNKSKSHNYINENHEVSSIRTSNNAKQEDNKHSNFPTKQFKNKVIAKKNNMFNYFNFINQNNEYNSNRKSISQNLNLFFSNIWQNLLYQVKTYFKRVKVEPTFEKKNNSSLFLGVIQFPKGFFTYLLKDKKQIRRLSVYTGLLVLVILGFAFEAKRTNSQSKEKIEQIVLDNVNNTNFSKEQLKNGKYITPNSIDGNLPLLLDDKRNADHEASQKADIKITEDKEAFALSRDKVLTPEVIKEELSSVAKLDKYKANQKANIDDTNGGLSTILTTYKLNWKHFKNNIFNNIKLSDTYNSWDTKSGTSILQTQVMISNSSSKVSYLIRSLNITFLDIKGLIVGSRVILINRIISPQEQTNLLLKIPDTPAGTLTSRVFINEQIEH